MKIFIGTSGWQYLHWRKKFYPLKLTRKNWLNFYAQNFSTVEINSSFYHLISLKTFKKWQEQTPKNFVFSLKLHRYFTHYQRLAVNKETRKFLAVFLKNCCPLEKKLAVILIQLPPNLKKDAKKLKKFLNLIKSFSFKFQINCHWAIEFRNLDWLDKEVDEILKKYQVAFCISDAPNWPTQIKKTADFSYWRFHGSKKLFQSNYSYIELKKWAEQIKTLKTKKSFIYFNNDFSANAVGNAKYLSKLLS